MTDSLAELTASIVSSYVAQNKLSQSDLPDFIADVHAAVAGLGQPQPEVEVKATKATAAQIRKSINPDALISFIDGRSYKVLTRHLTTHGHALKSYREAFGLPNDYPATAPSYSAARSELAKRLRLGKGERGKAPAPEPLKPARKRRAAQDDNDPSDGETSEG